MVSLDILHMSMSTLNSVLTCIKVALMVFSREKLCRNCSCT